MSELEAGSLQADDATDEAAPQDWRDRMVGGSSPLIAAILIALVVVFTLLNSAFLSVENLRNIALDSSVLLVIAVGATFVIITAGIDLSVGSVLVLSGIMAIKAMDATNADAWWVVFIGLVAALATGLASGLVSGFLIAKARIPAFIGTLGMLGVDLGIAYLITGGVDVRTAPSTLVDNIGVGELAGSIPWLVIISAGVALVCAVLLASTKFGRYTYVIGSNPEAARRAGINVDRHLIKVYALAGVLAGLAGFLSLARFSTTTIGGHSLDNLTAISGVAIGGTSMFGGIGTILGTVLGVFVPTVLQNGFVVAGMQPFWQQVAVGCVLIGAVYLDQVRRSRYRQ